MKKIPSLIAALLALPVFAQQPAVDTTPRNSTPNSAPAAAPAQNNAEQPAVNTAPAASSSAPTVGTNIFGQRESPIGLYIMPWRNSGAEQGIDRPARLLDEEPLPVDPGTFKRFISYHGTLSDHLRQSKAARP